MYLTGAMVQWATLKEFGKIPFHVTVLLSQMMVKNLQFAPQTVQDTTTTCPQNSSIGRRSLFALLRFVDKVMLGKFKRIMFVLSSRYRSDPVAYLQNITLFAE